MATALLMLVVEAADLSSPTTLFPDALLEGLERKKDIATTIPYVNLLVLCTWARPLQRSAGPR